jgi:hypothetical protein
MTHRTEREIDAKSAELARMANDPSLWEQRYKSLNIPARLEFPLGQIATDDWGFALVVAVARRRGELEFPLPITGKERFSAQGLEGKAAINSRLISLINIYNNLPAFRRALYW